MEYTDDKTNFNEPKASAGKSSADTGADIIMPKVVPIKRSPDPEPDDVEPSQSFASELAAVTVKAVAVALSVVIMLLCILAVALPLQTMRVFNTLGMSERAVDFGERYVSRRLREIDGGTAETKGAYTDSKGNYPNVSRTPSLSDKDFIEALYVCVNLSDKLMNAGYAAGDTATGAYYAERLEKYTRLYLSLNNVSAVSAEKNKFNIASMPSAALHPAVYSYEHDMRVLNYRARAYLGTTSGMTYNNRSNELGVMTTLTERANTLNGAIPADRNARIQLLDDFVDFVDQIGEYLDVQFLLAGVENDLSKKIDIIDGDNYMTEWPIVSEMSVRKLYAGKLEGNEFSLLVVGLDSITDTSYGFTRVYDQLKIFGQYAQWAVEFTPLEGSREEMLHQLYWLRSLSSAAQRLWYAEMLMYYNSTMFGRSGDAIVDEYGNCQSYSQVIYGGQQNQLVDVYGRKLKEYVDLYKAGALV